MGLVICALGGFLGGFIYALIYDILHTTSGIIDVDHTNNTCQIHITSKEIANHKNKKAIFKINHEAVISREEQSL